MALTRDLRSVSRFGHTTLLETLECAATEFGDQTIVHVSPHDGSEDVQTYRSLAKEANSLAELFVLKGWRPGDRMIFVVRGSRLFATSFWGCLLAGMVPVPLSALMNREPGSMEAEKIRNVIGITGAPVLIDSRLDAYAGLLGEIAEGAGGSLLYADELVREALLGHFDAPPLPMIGASDIAVLQFSSGSSGLPKAVRLTHHNIIANIEGQIGATDVTKDDVLCTWLPYFHGFGLFWGHRYSIASNISPARDPSSAPSSTSSRCGCAPGQAKPSWASRARWRVSHANSSAFPFPRSSCHG